MFAFCQTTRLKVMQSPHLNFSHNSLQFSPGTNVIILNALCKCFTNAQFLFKKLGNLESCFIKKLENFTAKKT